MRIRVIKANAKKASGMDNAETAVSAETDGRVSQVTVHVKIVDCYGIGHVIGALKLSTAEARALSARLLSVAADADHLLASEQAGRA